MEDKEEILDLHRYLDILVRWWWLLAAFTIATGLAANFYSKSIAQTVYSANTTILIQEAAGSSVPGLGNIPLSQQLAAVYKELVASGDVPEKAAAKLSRGLSADQLRGMTRVSTSKGTAPLLIVTVTSSDSQLSVAAANTLSEVFIQEMQTRRLSKLTETQVFAVPQSQLGIPQFQEAQFNILTSMVIWDRAKSASASVTPSAKRNAIFGSVLGGGLGLVLVFLLEYLNRRLRSPEQIGDVLNAANIQAPPLGVIYKWRSKEVPRDTPVVHHNPRSVYAEMFRQFQTVFQLEVAEHPGKVFLVTSAIPSEGKTTVVANLGIALAQAGHRVILVETDFRRPSFARLFNQDGSRLDGHAGLQPLLLGNQRTEEGVAEVGIPGLKVMGAGSGRGALTTTHLLGSDRMKHIIQELKDNFAYILFDSPPILSAADATILASTVDGVILVIALDKTDIDHFASAVKTVQRTGTPVVGYVVNKLPRRRLGYGRYNYHYYNYYNYYTRQGEDGALASSTDGAQPEPGPASTWLQKSVYKYLALAPLWLSRRFIHQLNTRIPNWWRQLTRRR
jgi:receptor protein-tyrosine kinase